MDRVTVTDTDTHSHSHAGTVAVTVSLDSLALADGAAKTVPVSPALSVSSASSSSAASRRYMTDDEFDQELLRMSAIANEEELRLQNDLLAATESLDRCRLARQQNQEALDEILLRKLDLDAEIDKCAEMAAQRLDEANDAFYQTKIANAQLDEMIDQSYMFTFHLNDILANSASDADLELAVGEHCAALGDHLKDLQAECQALESEYADVEIQQGLLRHAVDESDESRRAISQQLVDMDPQELELQKRIAEEGGRLASLESECENLARNENNLNFTKGVVMVAAATAGTALGIFSMGILGGVAFGVGSLASAYLTALADSARTQRSEIMNDIDRSRHQLNRLQSELRTLEAERARLMELRQAANDQAVESRHSLVNYMQETSLTRAQAEAKRLRLAAMTDLHHVMSNNRQSPRQVVRYFQDQIYQTQLEQQACRDNRTRLEAEHRRLRDAARAINSQRGRLENKQLGLAEEKRRAVDAVVSQNVKYGNRSMYKTLKEMQIRAFRKVTDQCRRMYHDARNETRRVTEKFASKEKKAELHTRT